MRDDQTFRKVLNQQIREAGGCAVCKRRLEFKVGKKVGCSVGLKFPKCRGEKKGFILDDDA